MKQKWVKIKKKIRVPEKILRCCYVFFYSHRILSIQLFCPKVVKKKARELTLAQKKKTKLLSFFLFVCKKKSFFFETLSQNGKMNLLKKKTWLIITQWEKKEGKKTTLGFCFLPQSKLLCLSFSEPALACLTKKVLPCCAQRERKKDLRYQVFFPSS